MFRQTVILFVRNFFSNITLNLLNLFGLAAGLAACMLILVYLNHEFGYDRHFEHPERLVRINTDQNVGGTQHLHLPSTSFPVSEGLAREISAVENYARMRQSISERPVYVEDQIFMEGPFAWADSTFFETFGFRLILGNPSSVLSTPNTVVLSQTTAHRFFGDFNPIGREIRLGETERYTVTGVMEDMSDHSHLPASSFIMSMSSMQIAGAEYWVGRSNYYGYLLLAEGHTVEEVQPLVDEVYEANARELLDMLGAEVTVTLEPIRDIHFDNSFDFQFGFTNAITYQKLAIFAVLGFFILLIACVSFINLATARSSERAHQVGISKAIGATNGILVRQYLGETLLLSFVALIIASFLVMLLLPFFSEFVGRELSLNLSQNLHLLLGFVVLAILLGFIAGIYPAFFLTAFQPSTTIRGDMFTGIKRSRIRSVLIVFQYVITIVLIICTFTVIQQLRYIDSYDPGFNKDQLMVLTVGPDMTAENCEFLYNELLQQPGILAGTVSNHLPNMGYMEYTYQVPEPINNQNLMTRQLTVDYRFIDALEMELLAGRNFDPNNPSDIGENIIINETAARALGLEDPIGHFLDADPADGEDNYLPVTIIGMVRDIHFESFHDEIEPMVLTQTDGRPRRIAFRLQPDRIHESIETIRNLWETNFPSSPFRYQFLDDRFEQLYNTEIRLGKLFAFFTTLAVVLSLIGIFALVAYSAERRLKEIGIRKVLGASTGNLMMLLTNQYVILILIANLFAWPVAWYAMNNWLNNFAYHAPFAWWLYPVAGLVALILAVGTVSLYALKACHVNPAETLRQE